MHYISTRGQAPKLNFVDALLAGLARDGGLYLPEHYPNLSKSQISDFAGQPYVDVAAQVIGTFTGSSFSPVELSDMLSKAYAGFRHAALAPLVQLDSNLFVLELFHGPTLAFKDVAMQLLGRMMDAALKARGQRATIVGATSGDTGAAAIEAFRGLEQVDVFILYPNGRVSDVQRRQMTTVAGDNIHTIALEGTFDDAQAIVKGMFNHHQFRDELAQLGAHCCPDGLLFYQRRRIGWPGATRFICCSHRQFRRYSCRLYRQAHGIADRPPDDWHQCQ